MSCLMRMHRWPMWPSCYLDEGQNLSDHLAIVIELNISITPSDNVKNDTRKTPSLVWTKCKLDQRKKYHDFLSHLISNSFVPPTAHMCPNRCKCTDNTCHDAIQAEYDDITRLIQLASEVLPRHKPGVEKDWWTEGLSELKQKSIEIHNLWKEQGKPNQGPTHTERLQVRAAYKCEMRAAQRAPKQQSRNQLHEAMASKDTISFWKSWRSIYSKNKCHLSPVVDGMTSREGIAESFKNYFNIYGFDLTT